MITTRKESNMDNEYLNNSGNNLEHPEEARPNPAEEGVIEEAGVPDSAPSSGIIGFDSATPDCEPLPTREDTKPDNSHTGYTVTPQREYYTSAPSTEAEVKINVPEAEPKAAPKSTNGFGAFFPSGSYGEGNKADSENPTQPNTVYNPYYSAPAPQKPPKAPKPPKPPKAHKKHSFGIGSLIAVALIASLLSSAIVGTVITKKVNDYNPTTSVTSQTLSGSSEKIVEITGDIEQLAEAASQKAAASVVGVQTTFAVQSFFSGQSTATGSGSGVIYKSDGYIITNYHVIAEALEYNNAKITVFLNNDTETGYDASVINYNISCDLAVLKIDKTGLPAIDFADSNALKVGQYVVAIGSPAGLEFMGSTTFGIISGLNRKISTTDGNMNLIQTDAAINPGNSGGALVNTKGELIGINSSKLVDESYEGMGFAIPANKVKEICDSLIAHEGEGEPYTGISISSNYTSRVLKYYGYPVGAVVAAVDEGSPAEAAGIRRGDIITKFGDTEITEYNLYETTLKNYFPQDKVKVTFYRSGETKTVTVTIGSSN